MRVGDTRDLVISLLQTPLPTVARHKAASCSEIKSLNPEADNGEYTLYPFPTDKDVSLRVYCHDMGSGNPKEFLSLPSGPDENYAIVIPDRLDQNYMYVQHCTGPLQNPYSEAGTTKFSKLRITFEGSRVEVIQDDYTFAQTTGLQGCAKGRFKVDLTGTELSLAPGVHWEMGSYWPKYLTIQDMFISEDRKTTFDPLLTSHVGKITCPQHLGQIAEED
ncbi:hypothetical protein Bbelb_185200 [Branchiostoma belcheri]|nr:hypothetical protein Bbelb_185200 [Branchiostoma belcheri]